MRPASVYPILSPSDRVRELAALFATALLRLRDRHALAADPPPALPPEILPNSSPNPLEVLDETRLSVHTG